MSKKIALGMILTIIGLIGVMSILTMDIPLPQHIETVLKNKFTPKQIKLLILINPTIMLVIAVFTGTILYKKVNLKLPFIEKIVGINTNIPNTYNIIKYGFLGGIITGILLSFIEFLFYSIIPTDFLILRKTLAPTLTARFLYGGFTEEILMRFGLMTLLIWLASKIFKEQKAYIYWLGIIITAIIFALGHFPIAYQSVSNPSVGLLIYILIGNTVGGIIFGWLYWKKGLESAFLAHIFAHIFMVIAEQF